MGVIRRRAVYTDGWPKLTNYPKVVDVNDLPEPWSTWATQAGVRASMTGIGEAAGVPASTISRLIKGRTTAPTISAVSKALRISEAEILRATEASSLGPWLPPVEAHLLDDREREALNVIIRGLVEGRSGAGRGAGERDGEDELDERRRRAESGGGTVQQAARTPESAGLDPISGRELPSGLRKDQADATGEESQDDGGMDPA